MKIGFLITARLKSTRLPKKLKLTIDEREMITWMVDRLKCSPTLDEIVIATSTNPQDEELCQIAEREGIGCFRGSELDVIERLYHASKEFDLDYVLNVTADCPLVAYDFIDDVVDLYKETDADLIRSFGLPHGFYFYGIKVSAMEKVLEIKKGMDTEVWGRYFTDTGHFNVLDLDVPEEYKREDYRLTLDYPEDFEFFKALYAGYPGEIHKARTIDIITYLDEHPEMVKINQHCEEIYKARWDSQNRIELK